MTSLQPGKLIGRYILRKKIGAGASAEVWMAEGGEGSRRRLAIKIAGPEFRRQLAHERRLSDVQHKNIVPILDSDTGHAQTPYLVMPYLSGGNLADLIAQHERGLSEDRVESLLSDILAGLGAMHRKGIVHRDIKPQNILLDEQGRAHICDFGLSFSEVTLERRRSVSQSASLLIEPKTKIVGTLAYLAPEIQHGRTPDMAADVFAVGVVLFEMLRGHRPTNVELPGDFPHELNRTDLWNGLYYWACQPIKRRYRDANAMGVALHERPKPIPFGGRPELPPLIIPPPAPMPNELWEGLAIRWHERRQMQSMLAEYKREMEEGLGALGEAHPDIRELPGQERARNECDEAQGRLEEICSRIAWELRKRAARLIEKRDELVAEGYLPNHPAVRGLERRAAPYQSLQARVEHLPHADGLHPLLPCLEEWMRVFEERELCGYHAFLRRFGRGMDNPWASVAEEHIRRLVRCLMIHPDQRLSIPANP